MKFTKLEGLAGTIAQSAPQHLTGGYNRRMVNQAARKTRKLAPLALLTFLAIEFLDELVYGAGEAAWPLIRDDLLLSYAQIGLLLSLPRIFGAVVEPFLGILADQGWRRRIILGGGIGFLLALLLTSLSTHFWMLLVAYLLFFPSSGAFVSLAQASLMDSDPRRREQNMARWTFAGSLAVLVGPLALAGMLQIGQTWRVLYLLFIGIGLVVYWFAWRLPPAVIMGAGNTPNQTSPRELVGTVWTGLRQAWRVMRDKTVLRWLVLLEFSDLMLDVLYSFLALYFVDVAGVSVQEAGLAVLVWVGVGVIGDFLLIPLLERIDGLRYLRISVVAELLLFPAFLLAPGLLLKLTLLGLLGLFNSGWYSILQANLYAALPGKSGTLLAVGSVTGLIGGVIPLSLGLIANQVGLEAAIWLLLAGPVALLIGVPRGVRSAPLDDEETGDSDTPEAGTGAEAARLDDEGSETK